MKRVVVLLLTLLALPALSVEIGAGAESSGTGLGVLRVEVVGAGVPLPAGEAAAFRLDAADGRVLASLETRQMFGPDPDPARGGLLERCAGVGGEVCSGEIGAPGGSVRLVVTDAPAATVPVFRPGCPTGLFELVAGELRTCRVVFVRPDGGPANADAAVLVSKEWDAGREALALPAGSLVLKDSSGDTLASTELAELRDGSEWAVGVALGTHGTRLRLEEQLKDPGWIGLVSGACNSDDTADALGAGILRSCQIDNIALEASSAAAVEAVVRVEAVAAGAPLAAGQAAVFALVGPDGSKLASLETGQMFGPDPDPGRGGLLELCSGVGREVCTGEIGAAGTSGTDTYRLVVTSAPAGTVPVFTGQCAGGSFALPAGELRTCRVVFVRPDSGPADADAAVLVSKRWDLGREALALPPGSLVLKDVTGATLASTELADLREGSEWAVGVAMGTNMRTLRLEEVLKEPGWVGFVSGACDGSPGGALAARILRTCQVDNVKLEASSEAAVEAVLRLEVVGAGAPLPAGEPAAFRLDASDGRVLASLETGQMFGPDPDPGREGLLERCPAVGSEVCVGEIGAPAVVAGSGPGSGFSNHRLVVTKAPAGTVPVFTGACPRGAGEFPAGELRTCRVVFVRPDSGPPGADAGVLVSKRWDLGREALALPAGSLVLKDVGGDTLATTALADLRAGGEWAVGVALGTHGTRLRLEEQLGEPGWFGLVSGACNSDDTADAIAAGILRSCQIENIALEAYPRPAVSIMDTSLVEGNSGTRDAMVSVSLASASAFDVRIDFGTANGTATSPADYTAVSGSVTIPAGQTQTSARVPVVGEILGEPNESFLVRLTSAAGATIADGEAVVTIANDDDTTPPVIAAKRDVVVESKAGPVAVLYSSPTATDNLDGAVAVTCVSKSGSSFPFGTTAVRCSAQDKNGNVFTSSFNVVVRTPTTPGAVTNPGNLDKPLTQVAPGQRVRVTAGGFKPGSSVTLLFVTAAGDAIELETTTAGENGRIDTRPKIPQTAPEGASQMTAVGIDAADSEFVRAWLLTVKADG